MKKLLVLMMIFMLVFSIAFNTYAESSSFVTSTGENFKDIANHWAKNLIIKLVDKGAIDGYLDGTFKPDNSIKVGEFTKILISSLGYDDLGNSTEGHWSLNYVSKAKEIGLIQEEEFEVSDLERNINRGEMARMIARAINKEYPSNLADYKALIKDHDEIPAAYQEYILKAFAKGIITGYEDGSFKYDKTATRAEASTMIVRLLDESERKIPELPDIEESGSQYLKDKLYSDKIVVTNVDSDEPVTVIPDQKESIEVFNKIINLIAENEKGRYQIAGYENVGVTMVPDENYFPPHKYLVSIKAKPNEIGTIYVLHLKEFDNKTVTEFKEILKVIFPTEYEEVYNKIKYLYDNKIYKNYDDVYKADGRKYEASYDELADRVNIYIKKKGN